MRHANSLPQTTLGWMEQQQQQQQVKTTKKSKSTGLGFCLFSSANIIHIVFIWARKSAQHCSSKQWRRGGSNDEIINWQGKEVIIADDRGISEYVIGPTESFGVEVFFTSLLSRATFFPLLVTICIRIEDFFSQFLNIFLIIHFLIAVQEKRPLIRGRE